MTGKAGILQKAVLFACVLVGLGVLTLAGRVCSEAEAPATGSETFRSFFWYDGKWPHERSDVPPDPALRYGRLENGLRYAVMRHAHPKGRVCLRLDVQAGTLMEGPDESGFAHFIEHMAFNGTRRFPAGELIPFFQRQGLVLGKDVNAHTLPDSTVYRLDLAATDRETLKTGLDILRDFGDALLFESQEVDQEREVILAEKRDRESEATQAAKVRAERLYGKTALGTEPIGTESSLNAASAKRLHAFYSKWYRADRMVVVVVGDAEPGLMEQMVREAFASMKQPSSPLPFPELPAAKREKKSCLVQQRPVDFAAVSLIWQHPARHRADLKANDLEEMADATAVLCLQNRLNHLLETEDSPWSRASVQGGWRSGLSPQTVLTAITTPAAWKEALSALQAEQAAALAFGFSAEEVQAAVQQLDQHLQHRESLAAQRQSGELADEIVMTLNRDRVFVAPDYPLRRFAELRAELEPDRVQQSLRDAFSGEALLYLSGKVAVTEKELQSLWQELVARAPQKRTAEETETFPYLPLPEEPQELPVLHEDSLPAPHVPGAKEGRLSVWRATLANGTRLLCAPTPDLDSGQLRVSLIGGRGYALMHADEVRTAGLATMIANTGGPGRLTPSDRARLLSAHGLVLGEDVTDYGSTFFAQAPVRELERLLQALWTQFLDPLPPEKAALRYALVQRALLEGRGKRFDSVEGVAAALSGAWFSGAHFLPLDSDLARKISLEEVQKFLETQRARGIRDIVVSGDVQPEAVLRLCARYFGSLPSPQSEQPDPEQVRQEVVFPKQTSHLERVPQETQDRAVVFLAWRGDVPLAERRALLTRRLGLTVLHARMREELREKLGLSYAPLCTYRHLEAYGGFGYALLAVPTAAKQVDAATRIMEQLARQIAREGVRTEELERQKKPLLNAWTSRLQDGEALHLFLRAGVFAGVPLMQWEAEEGAILQSVQPEELSGDLAKLFAAEPVRLTVCRDCPEPTAESGKKEDDKKAESEKKTGAGKNEEAEKKEEPEKKSEANLTRLDGACGRLPVRCDWNGLESSHGNRCQRLVRLLRVFHPKRAKSLK